MALPSPPRSPSPPGPSGPSLPAPSSTRPLSAFSPQLHIPHPPSPLSHSTVNPLDDLFAPDGGKGKERASPALAMPGGSAHIVTLAAMEEHLVQRRSRSPDRFVSPIPLPAAPAAAASPSSVGLGPPPARTPTTGSSRRRHSPRHSVDRGNTNSLSHHPPLPVPALPLGAQPPDPHHPFPSPDLYAPVPPPIPMPLPGQQQQQQQQMRELLQAPITLRPSLPALRRPPSQTLAPAPLAAPPALPIQIAPMVGPFPALAPPPAAHHAPPPFAQPIIQPEGEVCLECLMRDREMADVDVTSPGAWARASDVWYEELVRREADERSDERERDRERSREARSDEGPASASVSGEGNVPGPRERVRARGQTVLTEGNLKVWTKMNPKEPASRWHALQAYVRAQRLLAEAEIAARREAEREARLLDQRVKTEFSQVLKEDQTGQASVVSSPALNGTWGVRVKLPAGGKENVGIWGMKRRKRDDLPQGQHHSHSMPPTIVPSSAAEKHASREVTLLQNGLLVEHVDLRKTREAEERELLREERALEREKRRRTLSNRISFTGLGLGQPRTPGVGKGERASSYSYTYSPNGPAAVGGAQLGGYATTPWRASASASQPTLHAPTSPGVSCTPPHPYGSPFPTRPYAQHQQSPSASSRRLSSPLSSPNPHLQPNNTQQQRRESPRSSGEVASGVGLGLGRFSAGPGRFWGLPNGSDWSLAVRDGVGSGAASMMDMGSMVDMHMSLEREREKQQQQQLALAQDGGIATGPGPGPVSPRMRQSPEPMSPGSFVMVDEARARSLTPADASSLATSGTATTKKRKGLGGIWQKIRQSTQGRAREVDDLPPAGDPEKRASPAREEEGNPHEHLPPLAPPPPLSYLVNRRSAERSSSLSRPSSISSPSCSSPRSLSFSNPALPFAESYGSPATAPTSVSVSVSLDPVHGGGGGAGSSRIPSPTQSMRRPSVDIKFPAPLESPIMESPTLEPAQNLENTPSPSNTVVHNSATPAAQPQAHAGQDRPRALSLFKSLPPLPPPTEGQQRPAPVGVQSDPVPTHLGQSPPQAPFMQQQHGRRQSVGGNPNASWPVIQGQYSPPQYQQAQHGYPENFPEYANSRRSLAPGARQQAPLDHANEKNRSPKSPTRPKFNFAAFLRRKSFAREPEPEHALEPEYFVPEPNGYPSFEPPRLPFTPAANYASDMSQSQSSLSSHRPPSSIIGSINNRTSMLSAKIPQSDDFVAYRYPSMEQPVELFRR
ncbi:hypothetical protein CALCODRAFT_494339 [Calocera cornea HHB12733]|uniref:Uncharacterized protein n=1 Tax=Calocera cornea HHB12733 TaxID=1353952 RepID=A0A165H543_9BASI|nr:hypothetical protein CALCODRAFT_494339 [Calocera cornea HHB12733]